MIELQDNNDRALSNMQRRGTYSAIPSMVDGECTPEQLSSTVLRQSQVATYFDGTLDTGTQQVFYTTMCLLHHFLVSQLPTWQSGNYWTVCQNSFHNRASSTNNRSSAMFYNLFEAHPSLHLFNNCYVGGVKTVSNQSLVTHDTSFS
jgi:hypothetical protein